MKLVYFVWLAALGVILGGCGAAPSAAKIPDDPTPLAKCSVAKSSTSPLVTEWPASEKAHLESLIGSQAVVVSYTGCEMKILAGCRVAGSYAFHRTTLARDTIEITDAEELYAKVPLGAASLEATLEATGRLAIEATVVGQMRLEKAVVLPDNAACRSATHVIEGVSIGAFDMVAGGAVKAGGGLRVANAGAGVEHRSRTIQLRSAGAAERCGETTEKPHADCRSPLQVFLQPAARETAPLAAVEPTPPVSTTAAGTASSPGPADASMGPARQAPRDERPVAPLEVHFVADEAERWTVTSPDGEPLCKVPCVQRVVPDSGIQLRFEAPDGGSKVVALPDDLGHSSTGAVVVRPELREAWPLWVTAVGGSVGLAAAIGGLVTWQTLARSPAEGESKSCDAASNPNACTAGIGLMTGGILLFVLGATWSAALGYDDIDLTIEATPVEVVATREGLGLRF